MGQLEDMAMFVRIVEAGGIGKAAEQLNIAKSSISRRLNELEKRLDTQLLSRTTRKYHLTDSGRQFYQQASHILEEVVQLSEQTRDDTRLLDGTLKLTAPLSFGLLHLAPIINEYATNHKTLRFHMDLSDRHIDMIAEGFEMAIRIGELADSSFQAKRLTPIRHVLCASPDYLAQHGTPTNPSQLFEHAFLQYGASPHGYLPLYDDQGKTHRATTQVHMMANNGDFLKDMAIHGQGIAYLPTFITYQALASKTLVPVLTEYTLPVMHAYAVYPKNRFLSRRCRLLIDLLTQRFGDKPYWDEVLR